MFSRKLELHRFLAGRRALALLILNVALLVVLVLAIHFTPIQQIESSFGSASISITADRAWTLLPGQCATVRWDLEGIQSLYVNGEGKVGHDEMEFCPTPGARNLVFAVTAATGQSRNFTITIQPDLPSALASWLAMAALMLPLFVAGYFLATLRLTPSVAREPAVLLALLSLLLGILLWQAARPASASAILDQMERVFSSRSWHLLGSLLAGLVFLALGAQALRECSQRRLKRAFAAPGVFFVVVLILTAPAGFDSIGHWETWQFQAYFEGRESRAGAELVSRFWLLAPSALASAISPDSFAGYHFINSPDVLGLNAVFLCDSALLEVAGLAGVSRGDIVLPLSGQFRIDVAALFSMNFGKLSLLAAIYLVLSFRENPGRLRLLGIWLMLLLHLGSHEHALFIILIVPLLWSARLLPSFNLALIWYLALVAKLAQVALLILGGRNVYGLRFADVGSASDFLSLERAGGYLEAVANVYRQTFLVGWQEALAALGQSGWLAPAAGDSRVGGSGFRISLARDRLGSIAFQ